MMRTRRELLVDGLRLGAALSVASGSRSSAARVGDQEPNALVVLQLTGGNDALNMVVPHRQDAYYRLRPTLALPRASLLRLDDEHGLHPEMGELAALYAEGRVAVVHGVGYPNPNRSHFRSMEIWHTGDPDGPPGGTGWMGRLADQIARRSPDALASLHIGSEVLPLALLGREYFAPSVRDETGFQLADPGRGFERRRDALTAGGSPGSTLGFLRAAARQTYGAARELEAAAAAQESAAYPGFELARRLRLIARLSAADLGTRLYHVALGGFDTHARQAPAHAALLRELSQSLGAFERDLEARGASGRVLVLVFSEFGRRVEENASKGTDHGAGAPVLLVGGGVRGGTYGTAPDLTRLVEGDVPGTTDFRRIYATLEGRWLGLAPSGPIEGLDFLAL